MADTIKWPEINNQERVINPPTVVRTAESLWISQTTAWSILKVSSSVSKTLENPEIKKDENDSINWSKEERIKLKEELLIWELRKNLITKYPEQKDFFLKAKIRVMQLGKNYQEHQDMTKELNGNIFLIFSQDGKLISYLNNDWSTNFDIWKFNFDDDFANLLWKKVKTWYIRKNGQWKLELFDEKENKTYIEWTNRFNLHIFFFYLQTLKK